MKMEEQIKFEDELANFTEGTGKKYYCKSSSIYVAKENRINHQIHCILKKLKEKIKSPT